MAELLAGFTPRLDWRAYKVGFNYCSMQDVIQSPVMFSHWGFEAFKVLHRWTNN